MRDVFTRFYQGTKVGTLYFALNMYSGRCSRSSGYVHLGDAEYTEELLVLEYVSPLFDRRVSTT